MSQKVHPKGFRLRSQGHIDPSIHSIIGTWDSVWFSEPKKGKHLYTRILHEDQLIQDYTKGLFRSFGFYQQKCVIERKCNNDIHIISYVLRTPKLQPSKLDLIGTRTRQEKFLQEGLQKGWIPFLIKSVISKILYDKSGKKFNFIRQQADLGASFPSKGPGGKVKSKALATIGLQIEESGSKHSQLISQQGTIPSIISLLSPQESSKTQLLTNQKRFSDFWNSWLLTLSAGKGAAEGSSTLGLDLAQQRDLTDAKRSNTWWTHRSWKSTLYYPNEGNGWQRTADIFNSEGSGFVAADNPINTNNECEVGLRKVSQDLVPLNLTYSIQPTQSLIESSQLIVDYMADKIEQSVSIQQIYNELLRFFETEALCLGPSFITSQYEATIEKSEPGYQRPKVLGFRIVCSGRLQISSFSKPAEKAESIELTRGVLPLNTFKANIDFAQTYATNAYGTCGIKVWVNRGD